ncbi:hypothetical protein SBF1_7980002 [Candidatus Desulfosporosinus infrequens]|uniref:Uncharacterized protein n=1 Tax=Candidatus Desulfosporosinus infrequens TaxID=2043169 RepID=A0A2U3LSE2_9FIRM|nr:hypothetical protein SBF1_7980002 [Candidatus Desulfosporosinus infrequens]
MEMTLEMLWREFTTLRGQYDALIDILMEQITFPLNAQEIINENITRAAALYGLDFIPPARVLPPEQGLKSHLRLVTENPHQDDE